MNLLSFSRFLRYSGQKFMRSGHALARFENASMLNAGICIMLPGFVALEVYTGYTVSQVRVGSAFAYCKQGEFIRQVVTAVLPCFQLATMASATFAPACRVVSCSRSKPASRAIACNASGAEHGQQRRRALLLGAAPRRTQTKRFQLTHVSIL